MRWTPSYKFLGAPAYIFENIFRSKSKLIWTLVSQTFESRRPNQMQACIPMKWTPDSTLKGSQYPNYMETGVLIIGAGLQFIRILPSTSWIMGCQGGGIAGRKFCLGFYKCCLKGSLFIEITRCDTQCQCLVPPVTIQVPPERSNTILNYIE